MLIKDFYHILSKKTTVENSFTVAIQLHKDHPVFKGHFPENPITPGVCMVQIIKETCEAHLGQILHLVRISNLKFTAKINPNINGKLQLATTIKSVPDGIKIKNITTFENGTIALKYDAMYALSQ